MRRGGNGMLYVLVLGLLLGALPQSSGGSPDFTCSAGSRGQEKYLQAYVQSSTTPGDAKLCFREDEADEITGLPAVARGEAWICASPGTQFASRAATSTTFRGWIVVVVARHVPDVGPGGNPASFTIVPSATGSLVMHFDTDPDLSLSGGYMYPDTDGGRKKARDEAQAALVTYVSTVHGAPSLHGRERIGSTYAYVSNYCYRWRGGGPIFSVNC